MLELELDVPAGEHHDLVLVLDAGEDGSAPPDPERAWQATQTAWQERVPALAQTLRGATAADDARHEP